MLKQAIKYIIKFFANLLNNIFVVILVGIVGLPVLISWATGTLNLLLQIIKIPTPLWATIVLVLLLVIAYIKIKKYPSSPASPVSNYIIKYFTIGKFKWKIKIYDYGSFEVEKYPFCVNHDLQFIYSYNGKYCPSTEKDKCNNRISEHDFFEIYESAKSNIDKLVRNKTY